MSVTVIKDKKSARALRNSLDVLDEIRSTYERAERVASDQIVTELKSFLNENDILQVQLANALGVDRSFISQLLSGYRPIPSSMTSRIRNFLKTI